MDVSVLDEILFYVSNNENSKNHQEIIDGYLSQISNPYIQEHLVDKCLKKLIKDGFVEPKEHRNTTGAKVKISTLYSVTFDGLVFMQKGGYFERESIHKENSLIINDANTNPNKKKPIFTLTNIASVFTIIGIIVGFVLIPEDTPYLGVKWWKDFFGL